MAANISAAVLAATVAIEAAFACAASATALASVAALVASANAVAFAACAITAGDFVTLNNDVAGDKTAWMIPVAPFTLAAATLAGYAKRFNNWASDPTAKAY